MHQKQILKAIWSNSNTKTRDCFKKAPRKVFLFFFFLRKLHLSVSKVWSDWNKWSQIARQKVRPTCCSEEEEEGLPGRLHFVCSLCWPQLLLLYCCFPLGACDGLSSTMVQHEQQSLNIPSHLIFDKSSVFLTARKCSHQPFPVYLSWPQWQHSKILIGKLNKKWFL